jgi:hypothetical protein
MHSIRKIKILAGALWAKTPSGRGGPLGPLPPRKRRVCSPITLGDRSKRRRSSSSRESSRQSRGTSSHTTSRDSSRDNYKSNKSKIVPEKKAQTKKPTASGRERSRSRSRSRTRSISKSKVQQPSRCLPTNELEFKYIVLKFLQSDKFNYPIPMSDFFEDLRMTYKSIKGAYEYLSKFDCEKSLDDIHHSGAISLVEDSKGSQLIRFVMHKDNDKIEQLFRENHQNRPKIEIDLEKLAAEVNDEDSLRKKQEEQRKADEERLKLRRLV